MTDNTTDVDSSAALVELGDALAKVVTIALMDLKPDVGMHVTAKLASGEFKLRVMIEFEPFTVVGYVRSEAGIDPERLFAVDPPPFFVPVAMLVLARFLGRADPAVAHP